MKKDVDTSESEYFVTVAEETATEHEECFGPQLSFLNNCMAVRRASLVDSRDSHAIIERVT
jgi:hypothetical protein